MRPNAARIADGQHDDPPTREWLETDLAESRDVRRIESPDGIGSPLELGRPVSQAREDDRMQPRIDPDRLRTDGQRRRFYRNLLIGAGNRCGMSQRQLAMAAGLPHSRIGEILKEMKALCSS